MKDWGPKHRTIYTGPGSPCIEVISGLRPSSAYVFRLDCANDHGQFTGPGREFTFHTRGNG